MTGNDADGKCFCRPQKETPPRRKETYLFMKRPIDRRKQTKLFMKRPLYLCEQIIQFFVVLNYVDSAVRNTHYKQPFSSSTGTTEMMSNNANICGQLGSWREDDALAYTQNSRAFRKGISTFEAVDYYSQWAECHQYDEDLRPGRYNGPLITATAVADFFPRDREEKKIMDIAAGTGFVAEHLREKGFLHIDALEPSTQMILRAKEKGLYENYYSDFLTEDPLPTIMEDTYDCVVICGGMGEGHIPCSGIKELIRITKPGGLICIVMREQYLVEVDEYKDRLEPLMDFLEMAGKWVQVARDTVQDYFINIPGVVYMYTKI